MKKILTYLSEYLRQELKPLFLVTIFIMTGMYVYLEYSGGMVRSTLNNANGPFRETGLLLLVYLIPFFLAWLFYSIFYRQWDYWGKPLFWFLLVFAPLVFSLRASINTFGQEIYNFIPGGRTSYFYYRCLVVVIRDILILIPVWIYWIIADRRLMPFYGFTLKNYNTKPYLILLALMVPLVTFASFRSDFLSQYPRGFNLDPLSMDNPGDRKYFLIYELFYGLDFVFIEFFFRGFLLLAFYRHFGWACLIPMACFYLTIHFGKPLGETISSFFGGSILGILAIRTGSIAGGIIVHLGVAWLMEITALMHKIL